MSDPINIPGESSTVTVGDRQVSAVVYRPSKTREVTFALGALGIAGFAGLLALAPEIARDYPRGVVIVVGLALVVLFGTVGVRRLRRLMAGGEFVALTPDGIAQSTWLGLEFVRWDDIEATDIRHVRGTKLIVIRSRAPHPRRGLSSVMRAADRNLTTWNFAISASSLGLDDRALHEAIGHYLGNPGARAALGRAGSR